MTRGRKPKPTHLKLIEGNPGKRPIRTGPERPVTTMPEPPDHLNADARTEWDRVAHGLHALRLLDTVDRAALAAYCTAYARWVQAERVITESRLTVSVGDASKQVSISVRKVGWLAFTASK